MKSEELRAIQAPLKEKYRQDPQAALVTLRAQGKVGEGVACRVDTFKGLKEIEKLIRLTDRYCVVKQTLEKPLDVEIQHNVQE